MEERSLVIKKQNITVDIFCPSYAEYGKIWRIQCDELWNTSRIVHDGESISIETAKELALKMVRTKLADMLADVTE